MASAVETETVITDGEAAGPSVVTVTSAEAGDVISKKESIVSSIMSLENLVARKRFLAVEQDKSLSRKTRAYYKKQDDFIDSLVECNSIGQRIDAESLRSNAHVTMSTSGNFAGNEDEQNNEQAEEVVDVRLVETRRVMLFAKILLGLNVILVCGKVTAAFLSGSLAIVSVLVDNVIDLLSGLVIWLVNRAMMKRQPYSYPEGRRRLEPVAIIILAVVMSVASAQVVITGIERIIELAGSENPQGPNMAWPTLSIIGLDITVKLGIIIAFFRSRHNPSVATLIQDARNDVVNNTVSIACGLLAYHFWAFLDPIGAIGISSFIITGWVITLINPAFVRRVTWLSVNHDERINGVETVRAFHVGSDLFVEVDIVLPDTMPLKEAHNIGESLQRKLEALREVERAFVHLDYNADHHPTLEHKQM